jgi:protein HOOK3
MLSLQERRDALLKWLNAAFKVKAPVSSLEQLDDGTVFAQMLHEFEPSYDASEIQPQRSMEEKQRNLEVVFKSLRRVIKAGNFGKDVYAPRLSFFREVAEGRDPERLSQVCELPSHCNLAAVIHNGLHLTSINSQVLALLLGLAVVLPDNAPYIQPITQLDRHSQQVLMTLIQQQQDILKTSTGPGLETEESSEIPIDHGLYLEERLAQTNKALDQEKKKLADLWTRHEDLQEKHAILQEEKEKEQEEFDRFRESHGDHQSDYIKVQEKKIREQEELILAQENQLEDDRQVKERLQRELNAHAKRAEQYERLSDENKELRHQKEDLERRANAGERYKQKLESLKGLEATNQALQEEKNVLLNQTKDYETLLSRNSQLETTERMLVRRVEEYERNQIYMQDEKRALIEQIQECRATIQALETTKAHDERIIHELREQLQVGSLTAASPSTPAAPSNLEQELQGTSDPVSAYALEVSRLKAENSLLRNNMAVGSQNELLRKDLEAAKHSEDRLQDKYNDIYEKYALGQKQIEALVSSTASEGLVEAIDAALRIGGLSILTQDYYRSQAFGNIQTQALKYKADLEAEVNRRKDLEAELKDKNRELLVAKTDCMLLKSQDNGRLLNELANSLGVQVNAVGTDSLKALNSLKESDELVSHSLQVELTATRKEVQDLRADVGHKNSQLMEALISKETLRKRLDDADLAITKPTDNLPESAETPAESEILRQQKEKVDKLRALATKQKAVCSAFSSSPASFVPSDWRQTTALSSPSASSNSRELYGKERPFATKPNEWFGGRSVELDGAHAKMEFRLHRRPATVPSLGSLTGTLPDFGALPSPLASPLYHSQAFSTGFQPLLHTTETSYPRSPKKSWHISDPIPALVAMIHNRVRSLRR